MRLKKLAKTILTSDATDNPYVSEGKKEWNDRYHNMAGSLLSWKIICFCLMGINLILGGLVAKMACQSRVQPFVVETNQGMPFAIKPMQTLSLQDGRLINFVVNQFIINARSVLADAQAEKNGLNKVYAYSANHTLRFLETYYQQNNPFGQPYTVSVDIINTLPVGRHTWQVIWDESKRSQDSGEVLSVSRWIANLTYQLGEVNPHFILDNPFGFYITSLSWSQSQKR